MILHIIMRSFIARSSGQLDQRCS